MSDSPIPLTNIPSSDRQHPVSDHAHRNFGERHHAPSLDTYTHRDSIQYDGALSPGGQRADANKLNDDLELLRAERLVSNQEHEDNLRRTRSRARSARIGEPEQDDAFNQPNLKDTLREKRKESDAVLYKFWLFLKKFPRFIRYLVYLIPGAALLLAPILLGALAIDQKKNPVGGTGGVKLMWFGIWLMIVWCSLWVSRMITSLMPSLFQGVAKVIGSTNAKKWKDIGQQLELHTALFLWMLAVLVSFKPIMNKHRVEPPEDRKDDVDMGWVDIVNKVIIALFVLSALNFVEKILIQWIATSFHQRTYATRIENNKADTRQLVHLFEYSKTHLEHTDSFWQGSTAQSASGAQTPMQTLQVNARQVLDKVGYVAGKVGNDFIGRKVNENHPRRVVAELLRTTQSSHTLARLIYRSLAQDGKDALLLEDMRAAFQTEDEAEAAFNFFDKDLNGDITLEEMELLCNEVHLEKKAIAASLKDLDSVIKKLDQVFVFIIIVIAIIVFISILSGSAASGLASAGTVLLGLAWMLQATAQEFLQSIIFVFVKHPFDVGDRVTIYGPTGANLTGDDYIVVSISLLYVEFRKLEGHVTQAPCSVLNGLFILNHRRSNGLADPIPLNMRFGTPPDMIEELKSRMLQFCLAHKRDYQSKILTEMTKLDDVRSCTMFIIFFHKTNFQNELVRLSRHNRFVTELMYQMVDIGIQSPYRIEPGGSRDYPMYWAGPSPPPAYGQDGKSGDKESETVPFPPAPDSQRSHGLHYTSSVSSRMASVPIIETGMHDFQDVYDARKENKVANRLASIKEKDRALKKEEDSQPRGSTSALTEMPSAADSRSRIFGRGRSRSKSQSQQQGTGSDIV